MKVCRYKSGNTSLFTCPYHSWTYTTDGKLQGVPLYRSLYDSVLDREANSLVSVPKLCNYKGTIWASWTSTPLTSSPTSAMQGSIWIRRSIAATGGKAAPK